jgi:hypothetical protein
MLSWTTPVEPRWAFVNFRDDLKLIGEIAEMIINFES